MQYSGKLGAAVAPNDGGAVGWYDHARGIGSVAAHGVGDGCDCLNQEDDL
jgi:hypothetical protein